MKLIIPGRYHINLRGRVKLGNIKENLLYERLRDGRIMGLLAEDIIESEFSGLVRVPGSGASSDLVKHDDSTTPRLQCKSYRGPSVDLAPSHMKGKGRVFVRGEFITYCRNFEMFVLIDIGAFPELTVDTIRVQEVLDLARVTESSASIKREKLDTYMATLPAQK